MFMLNSTQYREDDTFIVLGVVLKKDKEGNSLAHSNGNEPGQRNHAGTYHTA